MIFGRKGVGDDAFQTALYEFGTVNASDPTRSAYVDYDNFAALDARTVTNQSTGASAPSSTIDSRPVSRTDGALLNANSAVRQKISAAVGGAPCQCEYTRWGLWSMTGRQTVGGATYDDRGHMMTWVAGQRPASATDVPTTGTATYNGHVLTNVHNGSNSYLAGANFTNTVNFGAASNQLSVQVGTNNTTLDGATFSGNLSLKADRRDFGGTIGGTLSRSMTMNGSFFKGASGPVGEMGGNVQVTGSNYTASGIFADSSPGVNAPVANVQ